MDKVLPTFIVIGAMKCGTTSLHDYLDRHNDIFMSKIKEVNFFVVERNWHQGVQWYQSQFDPKYKVRGESSQNYSKRHEFEPGVAGRIKDLIPNVKIIYIVRDPIDRIVSHYHEALEGGYAPPEGLNAALAADISNHDMVVNSQYHYQLEIYLQHFSTDQILVVTLEDLKAERLQTMNRIFQFLGVSQMNDDNEFNFVRNSGSSKRSKNKFGKFIEGSSSKIIRRLLPRGLKDRLKSNALVQKSTTTAIVRESLDAGLAEKLRETLSSDVDRLRSLTGQEFDKWSI